MKKFHYLLAAVLLLGSLTVFGQERPESNKFVITGKIIEKTSKIPLEYATITFKNTKNPKLIFGGITDNKGDYNIEVVAGVYDITLEFISFKPTVISKKQLDQPTNLGTISLEEDITQLNEVVIRSETTTLEIKLDKKVYNVGKDLLVKGGTVSDVLDNIPSVTVDVDGSIALRGNDNVRILIDGKPSTATNVTDALRLIPADAIDKVEVITNPSARYDAEGGGGILNIILKKGKTNGFNGTFIANTGFPDNHGLSANLNYKTNDVNIFTNQGFSNRNSPGFSRVNTEYFNPTATSPKFIYEDRENDRYNNNYNGGLGIEWFINDNTSWTNGINYRKSIGANITSATFNNTFQDLSTSSRTRNNRDKNDEDNFEFNSNFVKKFKKEGHKLNVDFQTSFNNETSDSRIFDTQFPSATTSDIQKQTRNLFATDYVLPFGKGLQFEAGYRGDFTIQDTDVKIFEDAVLNDNLSSVLQYKEFVNALYSQFGFKKNKFSFLFGLRWEDSNIEVNLTDESNFNTKKYNNFFPSAFVTYEISDQTNVSTSYSKRIRRPRGRFLNPSSDFSSNINIFQGNPDLNPAITDALEAGFLTKFGKKITFNTSAYVNKTSDVFNFVRRESGDFTSDGTPIILFSPVNIATEYRAGLEITLNYTPFKWWRLNSNFNFFSIETQGDFSYVDFNGDTQVQDLNNKATSWFTRLNSKVTLPYKIDWQTNMFYEGDQKNAQGSRKGIFSTNLAFSKDILKDKATIAFNVSDLFNSRIRKNETLIPGSFNSTSEFQWRARQYTLSFTYRFNKKKNERERKSNQEYDGGDFPG
ncbi:TonB-dependent receptor [Flavobacterium sp.]|uniref:TonB-dependent receptor domain-containing protein n=1 Tax=Flavobacterium sp. TaxID=239 RepID=UPI002488B96D|nr:TonB-dependent receptor [Flavobacterium sp.]MDI1316619.1 TonB-dependent receptor [Flavobacterium sp.]